MQQNLPDFVFAISICSFISMVQSMNSRASTNNPHSLGNAHKFRPRHITPDNVSLTTEDGTAMQQSPIVEQQNSTWLQLKPPFIARSLKLGSQQTDIRVKLKHLCLGNCVNHIEICQIKSKNI